ncbi:hypothetical protein ANRL4_00033 [Anaerolineae bacterium]|nr:hypothetical protein ANRL4_00033 [Anaerolineae bacterium]
MPKTKRDETREERISLEITVDAHDSEEQAMGWYCYLDEKLNFPFLARCIAARATSPLRQGDEVQVIGMAPEDECRHEMYVAMPWESHTLCVPLSQLKGLRVDEETQEAIEDWHYWVKQGYEL